MTKSSSTWTTKLSFFHIACRAAARRQYEALTAAAEMAERGLGYVAVMFVRPACEELIWIQYL